MQAILTKALMAGHVPLTLRLYSWVARALTPFAAWFLTSRQRRGKEDAKRLGERRGYASLQRPPRPLIWIHGASVGEALTILPLAERLSARDRSVLITTGTVTSATVIAQRLPFGVMHQYVPLDLPSTVSRFFDHWRPNVAIFAESELWPGMTGEAHRRGIPLVLVNGRMSTRSYRRWKFAPRTISVLLRRFDVCLAQSETDAERFLSLGARHVVNSGNLKFDVPAPPAEPIALAALRSVVKDRPVWIAASTHLGEERILAATHRALRSQFPNLLTIIAPRHPRRGGAIVEELASTDLKILQRSRSYLPDKATDIYIADTIGELGVFFRLSSIVFIGGSLVPRGGQNPIEAAKLGAAILYGPHVENFSHAYAALQEAEAARKVDSVDSLAEAVAYLLTDTAAVDVKAITAKEVVTRLGGALDRTMTALEPYLMQISLERR